MRSIHLGLLMLLSTLLYGQQLNDQFKYMSYQAVARDANGDPLANQTIGVKFTMIFGLSYAYEETQSVTTNEFGLFTAQIGSGTPTGLGQFPTYPEINWLGATGNWSLLVAIDPSGGTNYQTVGPSQQMRAVPFANLAQTALVLADSAWVSPPYQPLVYTDKNVGIGTDSPTQKFEVKTQTSSFRVRENFTAGTWTTAVEIEGSAPYGPTVEFRRGGGGAWYLGMEHDRFRLTPGGLPLLTATPDMRIGIKNNAPEVELDVKGNMRIADAGNVNGPDPSAALEVASTTGAVLLPRLTTAQRDALTPTPGMMIFNVESSTFQGFANDPPFTVGGSSASNGVQIPVINDFSPTITEAAQSFQVAAAGTLDTVVFHVGSIDPGFSRNVQVTVYDGLPTTPGSVLGSGTILVNATGMYRVAITSPPLLSAGTDYFFAVEIPLTGPIAQQFSLRTGIPGDDTTGSCYLCNDAASNCAFWNFDSNYDLQYELISNSNGSGWVDLH